jgi:hypothetical protein
MDADRHGDRNQDQLSGYSDRGAMAEWRPRFTLLPVTPQVSLYIVASEAMTGCRVRMRKQFRKCSGNVAT